ncbi:MAG: hypothetical protein JSU77_10035 [Fidelibacterota bacterium]|nr:MAG: hypothetical protein JSU77_10035 [Candidatus Neomarinimicrobiota bacterium]
MRLRTATFPIILLVLMGLAPLVRSQESGYLSQKLLLENTIQQRVTSAISKILDESRFVVDVKVELAFTPARQVEKVYRTADGRLVRGDDPAAIGGELEGAGLGADAERARETVTNPFPIPGFPDVEVEEGEPLRPLDETESALPEEAAAIEEEPAAGAAEITETTETAGGLPSIKSMAISIILEDGVSPQIIENVRQVALVASRFDRDRGDMLSITTASFKDRRPTPHLADTGIPVTQVQIQQTEALQEKLQEAQARNEELMKELRERELEYLQRSEEERKQALADLAQVQNERAKDLIFLQQSREEGNTRLQEALLTQIDEMRKDLTSGRLPPDEQDILSLQAASLEDSLSAMRLAFEAEKERLQAQIEAALTREQEQPQAQGLSALGGNALLIVGLVLLVLLVIIAVVLVVGRSRTQAAPVRMVYPGPPPYPRRRPAPRPAAAPHKKAKKKIKPEEAAEEAKPEKAKAAPKEKEAAPKEGEATAAAEAEVVSPAPAAEPVPSQVEDDPDVLRSEVKSIRQSVVSMSVGRPESATRIISNWLQQESAAPEEAGTSEEEGASGATAALQEGEEKES